MTYRPFILFVTAALVAGCATTEKHQRLETESVTTHNTPYNGAKYRLVRSASLPRVSASMMRAQLSAGQTRRV